MRAPEINKRANELRAAGFTPQQVYERLVWELQQKNRSNDVYIILDIDLNEPQGKG